MFSSYPPSALHRIGRGLGEERKYSHTEYATGGHDPEKLVHRRKTPSRTSVITQVLLTFAVTVDTH
jgi:hypothetical protein